MAGPAEPDMPFRLGWFTGPTARGKGLGAEKPIPSTALTGWAVDTLNKGSVLRSRIVVLQQDEA
jgi:hypothetical protein